MRKIILLSALAALAFGQRALFFSMNRTDATIWTKKTSTSEAGTSGMTVTTSTGQDTTGADICIVAVSGYSMDEDTVTVTDNKSNTYTDVTTTTAGGIVNAVLSYSKNLTVGSGHTWTAESTAGGYMAIIVTCWDGSISTGGADQESDSRTSGSTPQDGSITPSNNNQLVVALIGTEAEAINSINSGYTLETTVAPTGSNYGLGFAFLLQGSAAAVNPTWTLAGTPGQDSYLINASFKSQ